jgi:hypothetical protein
MYARLSPFFIQPSLWVSLFQHANLFLLQILLTRARGKRLDIEQQSRPHLIDRVSLLELLGNLWSWRWALQLAVFPSPNDQHQEHADLRDPRHVISPGVGKPSLYCSFT